MRSSAPSTRGATTRSCSILHPFLMLSESEAGEARRVLDHVAELVARGERWVAPGRELAALVGEGIRARLTVVRRERRPDLRVVLRPQDRTAADIGRSCPLPSVPGRGARERRAGEAAPSPPAPG